MADCRWFGMFYRGGIVSERDEYQYLHYMLNPPNPFLPYVINGEETPEEYAKREDEAICRGDMGYDWMVRRRRQKEVVRRILDDAGMTREALAGKPKALPVGAIPSCPPVRRLDPLPPVIPLERQFPRQPFSWVDYLNAGYGVRGNPGRGFKEAEGE